MNVLQYEIKSHTFDRLLKFKDNILLTLIDLYLKLPESFQPKFISHYIDRYSKGQIAKYKKQLIKGNWDIITLEKAAENIRDRKRH